LPRILAVDDDPNILLLVDAALTAAGHQVVTASSGASALALLEDQLFDAVVLDLVMPELSGLAVLKALREKPATGSLPVLILSSRNETGDRVRGLREGASDYLVKPWDHEELVLRVERLLNQGGPALTLSGDLAVYPPWNLLQSVSGSGGTGRLLLSWGSRQGAFGFDGGQLVDATLGGLHGDEAVVAALDLPAGRFRFQREDRPPQAPVSRRTRSPLGRILLYHAWLKDELERRRDLQPRDDQPLELATAKVPEIPEGFSLLPVALVLSRIKPKSRTSIESLEQEEVVAPLTLRLIVALLVELGTLVPLAGTEEAPVRDERFAQAVGRFLATAARRRPKQSDVQVLLAAEPGAWEALLELCAPLYQAQGAADRERLRVQLAIQRRGSFRIAHPAGQLDVHVQMIEPGTASQVEALAALAQGVAIWLAGDAPAEEARKLATKTAKEKTGLLLCNEASPAALESLALELPQWQPLLGRPRSLATVFEILG
jgi:CheY-like chemotaxis protein